MRRLVALALVGAAVPAIAASAAAPLVQQISRDTLPAAGAQLGTQVEPDAAAFGSTVVSLFQSGRFQSGGSARIGFATSTDAGATWTAGVLPEITVHSTPPGSFQRVSDPSIAYDAAHGVWLASTLALTADPGTSVLLVSRSQDGKGWSPPIVAAPDEGSFAHDKNWIVCDNGARSRFRGRCYIAYTGRGDRILTVASSNGGLTWTRPRGSDHYLAEGGGAQPVVLPSGRLVVVFASGSRLRAITSTNGGRTFGRAWLVVRMRIRFEEALRAPPLPSADVDGGGRIYVAWQDCRLRPRCPTRRAPHDILFATSTNGRRWSKPRRVAVVPRRSGFDNVLPALAADPATRGRTARLALTYYALSPTPCNERTCALRAAFSSSRNGGRTWAPSAPLGPPMSLRWLADAGGRRMVGDYVATTFAGPARAAAVFALAAPPSGVFDESIFAAALGV